jgi:imidazolonepropionase-like amidohydrolase
MMMTIMHMMSVSRRRISRHHHRRTTPAAAQPAPLMPAARVLLMAALPAAFMAAAPALHFAAAAPALHVARSLTALHAQTPAPQQGRPVALTGGTIHTVTNGVIENGTILFEEGRITAIGTNVSIPSHAARVDVAGRHIYPGLVDAYSQMGLFEIGGFDVTIDVNELGDFNPNARAHIAFNPESRHIGVARSNGVLVTVSSPAGGLISGHSAAMMLDGWTWEQMTLQAEAGLIINWPSAALPAFAQVGGPPGGVGGRSRGDAEAQYNESITRLTNWFADARAYRTARAAAAHHHASDARLEAMIPAIEGRVPVVIHANELRQIQDAVAWAAEEGVRMVLLGGRDATYVAPLLAQRQIPVLVTSVLTSPNRAWEPHDAGYALPAELHRAGVRVGITGAASAPYAHRLPYEAGAAIAYGLPADEALRAVTLNPAQFLGFADRVGSLEVGKDATLLITTGSPLEYATIVEQAYIEGRAIDMEDAHRRFFEKYAEKVRQMTPRPIVP